jgi:hypothetical protein
MVLIKLDCWHWVECWNLILNEPTKVEAATFRTLISQALFMIEMEEWNCTKDCLCKKLNQTPTIKEIRKALALIIPCPKILRGGVRAVLNYFMYLDMHTNLAVQSSKTSSSEPASHPRLYLKPMTEDVQKHIQNQLSHVDNRCLLDPLVDIVCLQWMNPQTGVVYTGRSTGSCEVDN